MSYFHWRWQKTETPGSESKDCSIHIHIVFCCPQRPQNNVGRFKQMFYTEGLCLSLGAEFRGKSQSFELWYITKPFQTLLPCLLLTNKSTCSIIGRHYPYHLRLFAIQVSLTRQFSVNCLTWERHRRQGELFHRRMWVWKAVRSCYCSCTTMTRMGQKLREELYLFHCL